jgi:hypothetical protein
VTDLEHPAAPPFPTDTPPPMRRRRWVVAGLIALIVLVWTLAAIDYFTRDDTVRFHDRAFKTAAGAICASAKSAVNEKTPPGDDATDEERAQSVERVGGILAKMAQDLHALPVTRGDATSVREWLGDLDEFVAVGPRYAAAIRSGDARHAEDVGNEGDAPNDRFNSTARANGLSSCVLG